jgi:hypothetical protein
MAPSKGAFGHTTAGSTRYHSKLFQIAVRAFTPVADVFPAEIFGPDRSVPATPPMTDFESPRGLA